MSSSQQPAVKLWSPPSKEVHNTAMHSFIDFINTRTAANLDGSYEELWEWSVGEDLEEFWKLLFEFTGIKCSLPASIILDKKASMGEFPDWFQGCRLNYAENILHGGGMGDDHMALISYREDGLQEQVTFGQLRSRVATCAAAFRRLGITKGDRIAGYIPNCVEAIVCMLAASACGAIWSSASCDFGAPGVIDRFSQITPRLLISVNAVIYNGRVHDHLKKVADVVEKLPSLEKVIIFPFVASASMPEPNVIPNSVAWANFMDLPEDIPDLIFEQLEFDHPLVVLFSSGTTGKPKCIVHGAGRLLLQHMKEHIIHGDLRCSDVFFYYTTTGWMMWNWMVSVLGVGSTVVLYDGSPFKPGPEVLWQLVDDLKITIFGTSAKYLQSLHEGGISPKNLFSLASLKGILSTGSPLSPATFDYVYKEIKSDLALGSITGGTDIASLFAGHCSIVPVYRGEIQCRCLGMKVEAWDESGKPVYDTPGDLVCVKPFPAMPVFFWGDLEHEKYKSAYFSKYPNIWYHGDFAQINSTTGGVVMLGRSDGTLNPSGVRFGSSDLYNITTTFAEIADSLAVGQKQQDDERVVLFLKMRDGLVLSPDLVNMLKSKIRQELSPRHVPAFILPISDIPYTLTGKKVEVAVKRIISGENPKIQAETLANPEALKLYYGIPELQL